MGGIGECMWELEVIFRAPPLNNIRRELCMMRTTIVKCTKQGGCINNPRKVISEICNACMFFGDDYAPMSIKNEINRWRSVRLWN